MPCHDILVQTGIQNATQSQVDAMSDMWNHMVDRLGLELPKSYVMSVNSLGSLVSRAGYMEDRDLITATNQRFIQTYVARQIFDALMSDGYEMEAWAEPDSEGTWVIKARDVTRNATIGVVVYHTLEFEIDFLDALHDDSVWLSGGEFGRVLDRLRALGLSAEAVKVDIDDEQRRGLSQLAGLIN